ncbi:uncharacterized protein [Dermacentor andersoni]|uniref:uncharacterized protein n=1 Tax=Dermacentor andersoni TaxID=34620 RepID=UPI002416345B|nr:uncharacterized protein LOC129380463 [Dermacentor andersoni]
MSAFLTNRTATVGIANLRSKTFHLPNRDDITLWTRGTSTGEQETRLQEAVNIIERYLNTCGLHCAPDKSELLVLGARTRGRPPSHDAPDPQVLLQGVPIPKVESLRILGVHMHKDGSGSATLPRLHNTAAQLTHLIRRVANRRNGLKEHDTLQMIQALLYSRITYGTPYLNLKTAEKQKLNLLIRKATKLALGLPTTASTDRLLRMGVHNSWEELAGAHLINQIERLKLTTTDRAVLRRTGYVTNPEHDDECKEKITSKLRECLQVLNIPRNMHPEHHRGRRLARVNAIRRKHRNDRQARYVDAAKYPGRNAFAISVTDHKSTTLALATILAKCADTAEEAAIALATHTSEHPIVVFTDSQAATRNYMKGRISIKAINILKRGDTPPPYTCIMWVPGHDGLEGNEVAHAAARASVNRASPHEIPGMSHPPKSAEETETIALTYQALLQHYRLGRRVYPPPHPKLTRNEGTDYRRLQSNTFTHGSLLHHFHPTLYSYTCPHCNVPDSLAHLLLQCKKTRETITAAQLAAPADAGQNLLAETWEAAISKPDLVDQRELVARARRAIQARGFLE